MVFKITMTSSVKLVNPYLAVLVDYDTTRYARRGYLSKSTCIDYLDVKAFDICISRNISLNPKTQKYETHNASFIISRTGEMLYLDYQTALNFLKDMPSKNELRKIIRKLRKENASQYIHRNLKCEATKEQCND